MTAKLVGREPTPAQVAQQCRAVAHMANVLAGMNTDYAAMFDEGLMDKLIDQVGHRTAYQMEALGNMLNNMDAVDDSDAWMKPVFAEAQRLWPQNAAPEADAGRVVFRCRDCGKDIMGETVAIPGSGHRLACEHCGRTVDALTAKRVEPDERIAELEGELSGCCDCRWYDPNAPMVKECDHHAKQRSRIAELERRIEGALALLDASGDDVPDVYSARRILRNDKD